MTPVEVVRAAFAAYRAQDLAAAEALMGEDLVFTSPQDEAVDRAAYFARCFPTAHRFVTQTLEVVEELADGRVLAVYSYELADGSRHRNAELLTLATGRIHAIEVFFGGRPG